MLFVKKCKYIYIYVKDKVIAKSSIYVSLVQIVLPLLLSHQDVNMSYLKKQTSTGLPMDTQGGNKA